MVASTAKADQVFGPIPRGERRRREIAEVAERVFFESGFADTTMQAIAARAGASKETLYRHFGSKEDLFAEIVASRARAFLEDLDERVDRPGAIGDVLRSFGLKILETMMGSDAISLCRIVIAESPRNPELGSIFMNAGPDRVRNRLTEFLKAAGERGELTCRDPACAARIFLGGVMTSFHLSKLVLPHPPAMTTSQMRDYIDEVVAGFMSHYASERCIG